MVLYSPTLSHLLIVNKLHSLSLTLSLPLFEVQHFKCEVQYATAGISRGCRCPGPRTTCPKRFRMRCTCAFGSISFIIYTSAPVPSYILRRLLHKRACDVCARVFGGGCKMRVVVSSMFSRTHALCMMSPIDPEHPSIDDCGLKSCGNAGSWSACPRCMRYCWCCNARRAYSPCSHADPSLNKLREKRSDSGPPQSCREVQGAREGSRGGLRAHGHTGAGGLQGALRSPQFSPSCCACTDPRRSSSTGRRGL
jgi:hypothetical protein